MDQLVHGQKPLAAYPIDSLLPPLWRLGRVVPIMGGLRRLFLLIAFFTVCFLGGCTQLSSALQSQPTATSSPYKVVYLTNGIGELTVADLKAHPEVMVALKFDDLKSHAGAKIALWVDKNAVNMVDNTWLNQPPQKYYPLVLVGYNDPLFCFRDILSVGQIEGPYVDWSTVNLSPGFCAWMIREGKDGEQASNFEGYNQTPTVQGILDVTNRLLEEKQEIKPGK